MIDFVTESTNTMDAAARPRDLDAVAARVDRDERPAR
jgi:hypothetical protein